MATQGELWNNDPNKTVMFIVGGILLLGLLVMIFA